MQNDTITLRRETPADYRAVETLTREAFWNLYGPGCDEHYLVHTLRECKAFIPQLDFVALLDGNIVGNILYAWTKIMLDQGGELPVITFGPVSVSPQHQQQGIGNTLIRHTLSLATQMGCPAVFIFGDPAYYSRFGFLPAENYGIGTKNGYYVAALQALELQPGTLTNAAGCFADGDSYHVDAAAAAVFDQTFPHKEKRTGTPSQKRFIEIIAMRRPRD